MILGQEGSFTQKYEGTDFRKSTHGFKRGVVFGQGIHLHTNMKGWVSKKSQCECKRGVSLAKGVHLHSYMKVS